MNIFAELERGKTYYLGNKLFTKGAKLPITESEREHLKENAIDPIRTGTEGDYQTEYRQKFKFYEEETGDAPKTRKRRKRKSSE